MVLSLGGIRHISGNRAADQSDSAAEHRLAGGTDWRVYADNDDHVHFPFLTGAHFRWI